MADNDKVVILTERPLAKYRWKMKQGHNEIKLSTAQMHALVAEFMELALPRRHWQGRCWCNEYHFPGEVPSGV